MSETGDTSGDKSPDLAGRELVGMLYTELRNLARARMAKIPPGNTLQPTALVHEAFLRVAGEKDPQWNSPGHFFGAAAQAMRQILVDPARRKKAVKHGGDRRRVEADPGVLAIQPPGDDILALDRALDRLQEEDPRKAKIVLLRYFAGLSREEAAEALGVSVRTIDREWRYIVARLHKEVHGGGEPPA